MRNLIFRLGLASFILLLASCSKDDTISQDLGLSKNPESENIVTKKVPINIELTQSSSLKQAKTSVSNANIDKFYLQIDQEDESGANGDKYDYLVLMKREYTPTAEEIARHPGKSDLFKLEASPAGDWSEWKFFDVKTSADGLSVEISSSARTQPMYFFDLSKSFSYKAIKWDDMDSQAFILQDSKPEFNSSELSVTLQGGLSAEQLFDKDIISAQGTVSPTQFANGSWGFSLTLDHRLVKVRVNIDFKGNFERLFEQYDNISGGDEQSIIQSMNIEAAGSNALDYAFRTSFFDTNILCVENSSPFNLLMTPISFLKKDGKWQASFETLLAPQMGEAEASCNLKIGITTSKFFVDTASGKYTIDETKKDRLFSYETGHLSNVDFASGRIVELNYELGDDYAGVPYSL